MPDNENSVKGFNTDAGVLRYDYNYLANIPEPPSSDIFECTYDVTPFEDIITAYNSGKYVVCNLIINDSLLALIPLKNTNGNASIHFETVDNHVLWYADVDSNNVWTWNNDNLLTTKLQSGGLTTTDKHIVGAINEVNADVHTRAKTVNGVGTDENGNIPISIPAPYDDTQVKNDIQINSTAIATNTSDILQLKTKTNAMPQDVQINGTSILDENKVANIPMATSKNLGVVKTSSNYGVITSGTGWLQIYKADNSDIDARTQIHRSIVPNNLDYAVKSAMCDGKGPTYTEAEKANARARIGSASEADVELLYKITQGQIWDFVDQQESGTNLAPKGTVRQSLISVDGKSEQFTTKGYQLLDVVGNRNTTLFPDFTYTKNGCTYTMNEDGSVSVTGNATSTSSVVIAYSASTNLLTIGETYTLSGCPVDGMDYDKYKLDVMNGEWRKADTGNGITFVAGAESILTLRIVIYTGYGDGLVFKPMLEVGSVAHDFEPYTGGAASPSPAYPQPITSVEQLNFKVVTGKNIFNLNDFENKYVVADSSLVGRYPVYVGVGKTVTLSTDYIRKSGFTSIFLLEREDDTATSTLGAYNEHPRTITAVSDYVYVGLYFSTTQDYQTTYQQLIEQGIHIQLEYGDSATPYEPYREETKQIIPPFALNKIGEYVDFANIENGEWVKNIYSRTVNSNDVYSYSTTRNAVVLRYTDYLAKKVVASQEQTSLILKSDNFTDVSWNNYKNDADGIATVQYSTTGETESFIQLRNLTLTTVDMWKNWLDSNSTLIMYVLMNSISEPIEATDLEYLKSLQNLDSDNMITITDQNGNDISYLMKYLVKLSEAI